MPLKIDQALLAVYHKISVTAMPDHQGTTKHESRGKANTLGR